MWPDLTFREVRRANIRRCEIAFGHAVEAWTPTDWACALGGETGECLNAVKKLRRHDDGTNTAKDPATREDCIAAIGGELADVVIYADLLAADLGLDLGEQIRAKFNRVSELRDCDIRL